MSGLPAPRRSMYDTIVVDTPSGYVVHYDGGELWAAHDEGTVERLDYPTPDRVPS